MENFAVDEDAGQTRQLVVRSIARNAVVLEASYRSMLMVGIDNCIRR